MLPFLPVTPLSLTLEGLFELTQCTSRALDSPCGDQTMVCVQMLSELEEVIDYKLVAERRPIIRDMWWNRLQGCQRVVEDWQRIMQVR